MNFTGWSKAAKSSSALYIVYHVTLGGSLSSLPQFPYLPSKSLASVNWDSLSSLDSEQWFWTFFSGETNTHTQDRVLFSGAVSCVCVSVLVAAFCFKAAV